MPSSLSSTLAEPVARSPAGSTAEICAVSVAVPCRSAGIFGRSSSNRPLSPVTERLGRSFLVHSARRRHRPRRSTGYRAPPRPPARRSYRGPCRGPPARRRSGRTRGRSPPRRGTAAAQNGWTANVTASEAPADRHSSFQVPTGAPRSSGNVPRPRPSRPLALLLRASPRRSGSVITHAPGAIQRRRIARAAPRRNRTVARLAERRRR